LSRAPFPRFNEKSLCGLGRGLDATGRLDATAVARTLTAVHRYVEIAHAMAVDRIDILATEAVRRAGNGPDLIAAIRRDTGLEVTLLTGPQEAYYATLGVISGFYRPTGLVGDIGGGSLEVAEAIDDRVGERSVSLPLGALPVTAMLDEAGEEAKRRVDAVLKGRLPPPLAGTVFHTVGGGWRALARIHMAEADWPVQVAHGYAAETKSLRQLAKRIWRMTPDQVAKLPGAPARRVATLPAAALVMDRVLKALKPERVVFSAFGLREGWLYAQLSAADRYLDPLVEGAMAFGIPRCRVSALLPALVRWTDGLFPGEAPAERRLRLAACALSDIGWVDHADVKARQCFHRLLQFPFVGLDHPERVFVAAAIHARYGGKADDPDLAPALAIATPQLVRRAQILGRALQLGYRFSGSVPEILDSARLVVGTDRLTLEVTSTESAPDSDAVRARLKALAKAVGLTRTEIVRV
ncbi:MAG: Ppx/GppA family phosphatase, partial [Alphaproteobacteria bacterium]|nr:Ppx/GppA family phosphatase [Alphaproteobacteria bacterium]